MAENPFGDLDAEFSGVEARAGQMGQLYPEGTYRFAIVPFEKSEGVMVEYDVFEANSKTKGIRMNLEILEPKEMTDEKTGKVVKTAGETVEKVFWVSVNNLPYLKHDFEQILQREIEAKEKLSDVLQKETWAGRTFEAVLRNEADNKQVMRNTISFITKWSPEAADAGKKDDGKKKEAAGAAGGKQTKF